MFNILEELEEEKEEIIKPVYVHPKKLAELQEYLDNIQDKLTLGQYEQCLRIWKYDPPAAIRYCKLVCGKPKYAFHRKDK